MRRYRSGDAALVHRGNDRVFVGPPNRVTGIRCEDGTHGLQFDRAGTGRLGGKRRRESENRSRERMQIADLVFWIGSGRRKRRSVLLPCPDRRGATKRNGGHPVPVPKKAERMPIEESSRAYRLPRFMKPRRGQASAISAWSISRNRSWTERH